MERIELRDGWYLEQRYKGSWWICNKAIDEDGLWNIKADLCEPELRQFAAAMSRPAVTEDVMVVCVKDWLTHCDKYRVELFASISGEKITAACSLMQEKEAALRLMVGMPPAALAGAERGGVMERKLLADTLRDIISKSPSTVELYPLLCAMAEVAHQLCPMEAKQDIYKPTESPTHDNE